VGLLWPEFGKALKPLGDGFMRLVRLVIAPLIFCTVVHGIASMGDLKKMRRIGLKTLVYFEVVSTLALILGLVVADLLKPGSGLGIDPTTLDANVGKSYVQKAHALNATDCRVVATGVSGDGGTGLGTASSEVGHGLSGAGRAAGEGFG
jgi:aerobic C4-dicarboxylate transport protein